ncbi:MAG: hypothetical protein ACTHVE_05180 [Senegalia sp. (in: firmicutes)]|uniref:hypothetical protein n=1 Tax=Senegalia sp. (in: firmicutes) TaxID=1924098 RepID=UPI003F9B24A7
MEEIIKKIIDIDKEAIDLEKNSKELIEDKQRNLRKYFEDIERKEQEKADKRIQEQKQEIKEETNQKIIELELKKESTIKGIEKRYMNKKNEMIKESISKILQV